MTDNEKKLEKLFEKYKNKTIPGTEFYDALIDFSRECYKMIKEKGNQLTVGDLMDYIDAAYHNGYSHGMNNTKDYYEEFLKRTN